MKVPDGLKFEITPEMAYPNGVPGIPEGYEFERFGYATAGEMYLRRGGHLMRADVDHTEVPLIIVRRKPQPKPQTKRRWVVEFDGDGAFSVIREAKPITRVALREVCRLNMLAEGLLVSVLEALGIEVEPYGG